MSQSLNKFYATIASAAFLRLLPAASEGALGDHICGAGNYK
jgi:hypothetical protein